MRKICNIRNSTVKYFPPITKLPTIKWREFFTIPLILHEHEICGGIPTPTLPELATLETILEHTWDTTEQVEYLIPNPPANTTIAEYLIHTATESIRSV